MLSGISFVLHYVILAMTVGIVGFVITRVLYIILTKKTLKVAEVIGVAAICGFCALLTCDLLNDRPSVVTRNLKQKGQWEKLAA